MACYSMATQWTTASSVLVLASFTGIMTASKQGGSNSCTVSWRKSLRRYRQKMKPAPIWASWAELDSSYIQSGNKMKWQTLLRLSNYFRILVWGFLLKSLSNRWRRGHAEETFIKLLNMELVHHRKRYIDIIFHRIKQGWIAVWFQLKINRTNRPVKIMFYTLNTMPLLTPTQKGLITNLCFVV